MNLSHDNSKILLDSRLISATIFDRPKLYNFKIIQCGSFIQIYKYLKPRIKHPSKNCSVDLNLKKINFENDFLKKDIKLKTTNEIEKRNITRSKLQCQRIAKANMEYWETFITLTFAENITNNKLANKRFKYFVDKVRRVKKDFRYLVVPEYQKRGAIHYHLLTNISLDSNKLIYSQENNLKFKHIKYWLDGFNSVEKVKGDAKKIIVYISKYMTKDIDSRLFAQRRFFYSQNCIVPKVSYIDSMSSKDLEFLQKKIQDKKLIYQNEYLNTYDNTKVVFLELTN